MMALAVLDAFQPIRELWPILPRLGLVVGIRIVVGGAGPTVGIGTHRRARISRNDELAEQDPLLVARADDEPSGQLRTLVRCHHSADRVTRMTER